MLLRYSKHSPSSAYKILRNQSPAYSITMKTRKDIHFNPFITEFNTDKPTTIGNGPKIRVKEKFALKNSETIIDPSKYTIPAIKPHYSGYMGITLQQQKQYNNPSPQIYHPEIVQTKPIHMEMYQVGYKALIQNKGPLLYGKQTLNLQKEAKRLKTIEKYLKGNETQKQYLVQKGLFDDFDNNSLQQIGLSREKLKKYKEGEKQ